MNNNHIDHYKAVHDILTSQEIGTPVLAEYLHNNTTLTNMILHTDDPYSVIEAIEFSLKNLTKSLTQNQCEVFIKLVGRYHSPPSFINYHTASTKV